MKQVLIAEDNAGDRDLIQMTFDTIAPEYSVRFVTDGEELVAYLAQANPFDLTFVMLDLNMPGRDGHDALATLLTDERFNTLPIIVFSSSTHPDDVTRCYLQGANAYVRKPDSLGGYSRAIQAITDFWGNTNVLARPAPAAF